MPLKVPSLSVITLWLVIVAVLGASVTIWGLIFARLGAREPIVPYEPRRPLPRGGIDILMVVLLGLVVLMIGALVARTVAATDGSTTAAMPPAPSVSSGDAKQTASSEVNDAAAKTPDSKHDKSAKQREIGPNDLISSMCLELIVVVLLVAAVRAMAGATWRDLGLNFSRLGYDAALGVCAYLAAIVPLMALQWALAVVFQQPYTHPIIEGYKHQPNPWMLSLTALSAIIVAPLCEELLFRVLLQGWFESLEGTWQKRRRAKDERDMPPPEPVLLESAPLPAAGDNPYAAPAAPLVAVGAPASLDTFVPKPACWPILLSSVLFAMMHFGQGLAPVSLFFLALVLGYLYQRTHRLWPSLVVHVLLNAGSILVLWLSVSNSLPIAK